MPARFAPQRGDEAGPGRAEPIGDHRCLVGPAGAGLGTINLLQGNPVGVQHLCARVEIVRQHLALMQRPTVQKVPGGEPDRRSFSLFDRTAWVFGHPSARVASVASTMAENVCSRSCAVVSSAVTRLSLTVQTAAARAPNFAARVYSAAASISTASTPY